MKIRTSYNQFKQDTGYNGNPDKRGPQLTKIDGAFEAYLAQFDTAQPSKQLELTADLFTVCKDWLKEKSGKSDYKESLLKATKLNTNLRNRRNAIKALAQECLDCMLVLDPELFAKTRFERHKIDMLSKGRYRNKVKDLSKGYDLERTSWLKRGKDSQLGAYSGSGVREVLGGGEWRQKMRGKKLDELNYKDFEKIAQSGSIIGGNSVKYLKKGQRLEKMLTVGNNGQLVWAATGQVASWGQQVLAGQQAMVQSYRNIQGDLYLYAMDSYGNLMSTQLPDWRVLGQEGFAFFNHSSFHAGREVTSAGLLLVQNGQVRWIDNNSGHYKPARENLQECISLLAADNADLTDTVVASCVFADGELAGFDCFTPTCFVSSLTAQPDLPQIRLNH